MRRIDALAGAWVAYVPAVSGDFTNLIAWQVAVQLTGDVVALVQRMRGPGATEAISQMLRAAESIPANIAEGYGRGLGRDFSRFLRIARGSAAELESHLVVAAATGRCDSAAAEPVIARCRRVRALIRGLAAKVASATP